MRESMARLTPRFSTNRVVRQYTEDHYLQAAAAYRERVAGSGFIGSGILKWQREIAEHWSKLHFGSSKAEVQGQEYVFQAQVFLDDLDAESVAVELYAENANGSAPLRQVMTRGERLAGSVNAFAYSAKIQASRPLADFTPRIVPFHARAFVPLEAPFILWQDNPGWR
jgi:glycogen phosphorylase